MVGSIQAVPKLQNSLLISKIVVLLLVVGCASPPVQQKPEFSQSRTTDTDDMADTVDTVISFRPEQGKPASYPAWFWNVPSSEDDLFAVGRANTSVLHPENSEQAAIQDGVENLAKSLSVHINGKYEMVRQGGRILPSGNDMHEETSAETLAFVEKNHQLVAKFVCPLHTFVLLSLGEGDSEAPVLSAGSNTLPKEPGWLTNLPKEPGYLYASGHKRPFYRETNSWSEAERHARTELALMLESKVRSAVHRYQMSVAASFISVSTDIQLEHAQVIARWKHPEHNYCNVLVKMPLSKAKKTIARRADVILPSEHSQKSREQIIQEAFDELEREINPEE